jgi:Methyltransferase domain
VGAAKTLNGGTPDDATSSATSDLVTVTSAGHYCFRGEYSGDGLYPPSNDPKDATDTSTTECFLVNPVTPTIMTTATGSGNARKRDRWHRDANGYCKPDHWHNHSPEMLAFSAARNRTAAERGALELKLGDAAAIPWPDETFGVLVCANAFFFFERPALVLAEFVRVLRRGGRLVIGTQPGRLPPVSLRRWWVAVWGSAMHEQRRADGQAVGAGRLHSDHDRNQRGGPACPGRRTWLGSL